MFTATICLFSTFHFVCRLLGSSANPKSNNMRLRFKPQKHTFGFHNCGIVVLLNFDGVKLSDFADMSDPVKRAQMRSEDPITQAEISP